MNNENFINRKYPSWPSWITYQVLVLKHECLEINCGVAYFLSRGGVMTTIYVELPMSPSDPVHKTAWKPRLRRAEAVEYLRIEHGLPVTVATLAKLASVGGGPRFEKMGRI